MNAELRSARSFVLTDELVSRSYHEAFEAAVDQPRRCDRLLELEAVLGMRVETLVKSDAS